MAKFFNYVIAFLIVLNNLVFIKLVLDTETTLASVSAYLVFTAFTTFIIHTQNKVVDSLIKKLEELKKFELEVKELSDSIKKENAKISKEISDLNEKVIKVNMKQLNSFDYKF